MAAHIVQTVRALPNLKLLPTLMTINLPRREKAAAKVGPRLDISPLELKDWLQNEHGLSRLISEAESWEPFAWKGNDLSAPLRALYVAEARGLLSRRGDRAVDVAIADITADINGYLGSFGKSLVSEASVLNNLRQASLYVQAAVGAAVLPDRRTMTVRLVDQYETTENIEKYFDSIKGKLQKLGSQLKHAEACGYDVSHVLAAAESSTGVKLLSAA
jgi:hypothetical protein